MSDTALGVSSTGGFFLWHCQDDFTLFGPKMDWRLATGDWRLATGDWRLATGDWLYTALMAKIAREA